jgi:predicted MFS family arabinose efflux permease
MPSPTSTLRESLRLLGTRRFGTFWFASLLSGIGTWAQQLAEPWLLLTLGASPFLIGLDTFAMDAPVWLLTLAGGALADRADRRRVIGFFQSIQMLCPTAIVILVLTRTVHPWMIITLSMVVGVTDALSLPSFQSIVPSIVTREQVGRGLALNSTQFNLSRILGPAIAGVLISTVGITACFGVSAASYIPFIGVALWILPRGIVTRPSDAPMPSGLLTGVRDILRHRQLRAAILTVFATGLLCAPLVTFSPVLVQAVFHGGAGRFSASLAAFGVGGLLGGMLLLAVPAGASLRRISSGFAIALAAVLVVTALNPWAWGLPLLLLLAGTSMTVSNTAANSVVQSEVLPHLLGRTVSIYMLAIRGGGALGALLTGVAVSRLGVRPALLLDGLLALVTQVLFARAWATAPSLETGTGRRYTDWRPPHIR